MDRRHNRWHPEPPPPPSRFARRRKKNRTGHLVVVMLIVLAILAIGMSAPSIRFDSLLAFLGFR